LKKILVVGSTGRTGRLVLQEGLRRGLDITAFARTPEKLAGLKEVRLIRGDGLNLDDVRRAVSGQDAVICAVGSLPIARNLLAAMDESGVRRLVILSAYPATGKRPRLMLAVVRLAFGRQYRELAEMERLIAESTLEWTIVRPPMLNNRPASGRVRQLLDGGDFRSGPYVISRADLAATLLDMIQAGAAIRKSVPVSQAGG